MNNGGRQSPNLSEHQFKINFTPRNDPTENWEFGCEGSRRGRGHMGAEPTGGGFSRKMQCWMERQGASWLEVG